jgi:hypothetical protein
LDLGTGPKDKYPKGEVGILKAVLPSKIMRKDRCILPHYSDIQPYLGIARQLT